MTRYPVVGHDGGQAPDLGGLSNRQGLGDHSTKGDADDMRGAKAEVMDQPSGVGCHISERIRTLPLVTVDGGRKVRRNSAIEVT